MQGIGFSLHRKEKTDVPSLEERGYQEPGGGQCSKEALRSGDPSDRLCLRGHLPQGRCLL